MLWSSRLFIKQRCEPQERAGRSQAERAPPACRCARPGRGSEVLLCLRPAGDQEAYQEMHVLHLQGQGVCVLLPPGHHLDQHARVRVTLSQLF